MKGSGGLEPSSGTNSARMRALRFTAKLSDSSISMAEASQGKMCFDANAKMAKEKILESLAPLIMQSACPELIISTAYCKDCLAQDVVQEGPAALN